MAASQESVYNSQDVHIIRLRKIHDLCSKKVLRKLLEWLAPNFIPTINFKDHLNFVKTKRRISLTKFRKDLKPKQADALKNDPLGNTWDVSLLFILILYGSEFLADMGDPVWETEGDASLESLIKSVKDERNEVMHIYEPVDIGEFHQRTEKMRGLFQKMINLAQTTFEHIPQDEADQLDSGINLLLNKCRDDRLESMDFEEYKQQKMFQEQRNFVEQNGKEALHLRHRSHSSFSPASYLAEANVDIKDIFTDMVLQDESSTKKEKVDIRDLFCDNQALDSPVILLEGIAGIGKTTLIRKILNDWTDGITDIDHLQRYDLVLHAECRDQIETFKELLECSLGDTHKSFQDDDLKRVTLDLCCLIILDGLDEVGEKSAKLFKEILFLKKNYGIDVLITTRPEALDRYNVEADSQKITTKHIQLTGIPKNKREEYVSKYYDSIEKDDSRQQGKEGLLLYLKRTEYLFSNMWKLPYNLTLLTILWVYKPDIVNSITTFPELYWHIFLLHVTKLTERLRQMYQHLPASVLKTKIDHFMHTLSWESLMALKNDDITLPPEVFQILKNKCNNLDIPVEEMAGMFLKSTKTSSGIRYSFPHKGQLEFLAANYIWMQISGTATNYNIRTIMTALQGALSQNDVPAHVSDNILQLAENELRREQQNADRHINTPISNALFKLHDSTSVYDVNKYQNMIITLVGLFYLDNDKNIEEATKEDAMELLSRTGVRRSKDQWISILNMVRCDNYVASYVSIRHGIFEGDIEIDDSTLFAYISVMKAMPAQFNLPNRGDVFISIKEANHDINELLGQVNEKQLTVKSLLYHQDFKHVRNRQILEETVNSLFLRCPIEEYLGALTPYMKLPFVIRHLSVSIADDQSCKTLNAFLVNWKIYKQSLPVDSSPFSLNVCVSLTVNPSVLKPLSGLDFVGLCLPDIQTLDDMRAAAGIAKSLQPTDRSFDRICFPRLRLHSAELTDLIEHMKGVKVLAIVFLSPIDISSAEKVAVTEFITWELGSHFVWWEWNRHVAIDIDNWET